jgi:methylthioribulose-1-phosphate dehydratase
MEEAAKAMGLRFEEAAAQVVRMARHAGARGWVPATSGNFSVRLNRDECAVTASGGDKGQLTEDGVIKAPIHGPAPARQSAEAELHYRLYRLDPAVGAVAHVHAMPAVLASLEFAGARAVRLEGLELLKAFHGIATHETRLDVPIFANDQDMMRLGAAADARLTADGLGWGYLIEGHGLYAWGPDTATALRHLDAFDYLFTLTLKRKGIPA